MNGSDNARDLPVILRPLKSWRVLVDWNIECKILHFTVYICYT